MLNIIDKILRPVSRRLDDSSPMVDARLPDGSRVNAVIPPLAVHGPSLTIRKFSRELLAAEDLVRLGTLGRPRSTSCAACVRARANILISGGTGTGKTTLLNLLSAFIPNARAHRHDRGPGRAADQARGLGQPGDAPAEHRGQGQVVQRDLVKNALRMRPDRIIVGECRGGEAFDMLQAMNTGHDGSLTTVHANSPRDALSRIENMVLMAVELPVAAIREQIASGINLLVHLSRMQDGTRRVTHVTEIVGMQGSVISMHDIFEFQGRGVDAHGRDPRPAAADWPAAALPRSVARSSASTSRSRWFLPMAQPDGPENGCDGPDRPDLVARLPAGGAGGAAAVHRRLDRTSEQNDRRSGSPRTRCRPGKADSRRSIYGAAPPTLQPLSVARRGPGPIRPGRRTDASACSKRALPLRAGEFLFLQLVVATIGGLVGAVIGAETLRRAARGARRPVVGFVGPLVWLRLRVAQRKTRSSRVCPEALDRVVRRAARGLWPRIRT